MLATTADKYYETIYEFVFVTPAKIASSSCALGQRRENPLKNIQILHSI